MWSIFEKAVKDFQFTDDEVTLLFHKTIEQAHAPNDLVYIGTLSQAIELVRNYRPGLADNITQNIMGGPLEIVP